MSGTFYFKLAATGISKNRKMYFPYLLTCVCMVMMYYIVSFLCRSSTLREMHGGDTVQQMLSLGVNVIAVFSLIFLYYTNSFLIRRRQKEFGLYHILGMGKRNLVKIMICENLLTAAVSIAGGLVLGILFSKLGELVITRLLGENINFDMEIDPRAIVTTVLLFVVIFALIMVRMLVFLWRSRPVEMLRSDKVGEKPPKGNWFFALAGIVLLGAAYYLAVTIEDPITALMWFFIAVIMVIAATYLLFIAGSVTFGRLLQKNKRYYYRTNHFVSLSSMIYRMKRNGAGLASICILSTMVLVMVSGVMCLWIGMEDMLHVRYPREITAEIYTEDEKEAAYVKAIMDQGVEEHGAGKENIIEYTMLQTSGVQRKDQILFDFTSMNEFSIEDTSSLRESHVITIDDYNRLKGTNETLEKDEVMISMPKNEEPYSFDTITIGDGSAWTVKSTIDKFNLYGTDTASIVPSLYIFVPDKDALKEIYEAQAKYYQNASSEIEQYYGFDLDCPSEEQIAILEEIFDRFAQAQIGDEGFSQRISLEGREMERAYFLGMYGGLFFLGIILGLVFIAGMVIIIYYKQISEGYEDQERFDILMKIGMTRKEVRKSVNSQVLTVFFLPLIVAGLHTGFAFPIIRRILNLMGFVNTTLLIWVTVACYLVFALFYIIIYLLTSKSYLTIVGGKTEKQ